MKTYRFAIVAAMVFLGLVGCRSGVSLEELANMSKVEKMGITELYIAPLSPAMEEFHLWDVIYDMPNLKKLELDENFHGTITGSTWIDGMPKLTSFVARGAKIVGHSVFISDEASENLTNIELPEVIALDWHAFGGNNKVRHLKFPKLRDARLGSLSGFHSLETLELSSHDPISMWESAFSYGGVDTKNITLFLGDYDYRFNVEGNVWHLKQYNGETQEWFGDDSLEFRSIMPSN